MIQRMSIFIVRLVTAKSSLAAPLLMNPDPTDWISLLYSSKSPSHILHNQLLDSNMQPACIRNACSQRSFPQMRSEDCDSAGNVTESEGLLEWRDTDVLVVGKVGDEEAADSAEVLRGAGGAEIEEGEGTGEGKGEGGESTPKRGGESGEDQAEGS